MIKDINIMAQPFKITAIIFIVISIIIDIKMVLEEIKKKDRHNKRSRMVLVCINFLIFLVSMHFRNLTSKVFAISTVLIVWIYLNIQKNTIIDFLHFSLLCVL